MTKLTIEIADPKAMRLIEDLVDLELIKVVNEIKTSQLSKKLRGSVSKKSAAEFNKYLNDSRKEWERGL